MSASKTTERVPSHTAPIINREIMIQTEARIRYYANHIDEIDERIDELDAEWDVERVLEANAATLTLGGIFLGTVASKKYLLFSAGVMSFLLQHAIKGWCPPLALLRRIGVRTPTEIEYERYALKMLRGDFPHVGNAKTKVEAVLDAVCPGVLKDEQKKNG